MSAVLTLSQLRRQQAYANKRRCWCYMKQDAQASVNSVHSIAIKIYVYPAALKGEIKETEGRWSEASARRADLRCPKFVSRSHDCDRRWHCTQSNKGCEAVRTVINDRQPTLIVLSRVTLMHTVKCEYLPADLRDNQLLKKLRPQWVWYKDESVEIYC